MSPEQINAIRQRVAVVTQHADQLRPQVRAELQRLATLYGAQHSAESYQNLLMLHGLTHLMGQMAYIGVATMIDDLVIKAEEVEG